REASITLSGCQRIRTRTVLRTRQMPSAVMNSCSADMVYSLSFLLLLVMRFPALRSTAIQQADDAAAQLHECSDLLRRQRQHLLVPACQPLDECEHLYQAPGCLALHRRVAPGRGDTFAQCRERRIQLARLTSCRDAVDHGPQVGFGLEVIASIAEDRNTADQLPGEQLAERGGDIRACH